MVKTKIKKAVSLMLATVMSLTAFMGIGATTAFAAVGEKADVYLVDYPRSGDTNNNGEWGHGNLNYMNGWKGLSTKYTGLRAMGSYSGNIAYCIEPGTGQRTGDTLTEKDENFFNNISPNGTISGDDIRLLIGRILQYGYRGGISTSWKSQNESDANCIAHAYATQILIWETIVGERDAGFNHVSTGGYNAVLECVSSAHPLRSKILSYYNSMVTSVQYHTKVPSFCTRSSGSAKVNELEWNGSKYVATLTDTNGVLGNYNFSANIDGASFSVSGNKLTVSMEKAPSKEFTITAAKKNGVRRGVVVWTDGIHQNGNGIQDVVTYAQEVSDPVSGFVKMKVSYGSCQIVKTSEDGKVDGIQFTISGNGVNQTVTTANGGKFQLDNLMPGVYTVTEQSIDKYVPQEVHRVTVVAGQVAKVNFNNVLKRGNLRVIKSSEDNLVEGVTFHLYGTSLSGIAVEEYAVTDKNGVASFDDVLISGTTPYTIEEVDTAIRYVVPANQTAPINWKEVTTRNFTNILKKFSVTVTKSDREEGTPQGDATLAGAVYGIYKGETLVDKYVTDKNGQFTTKEYICDDDWTIREITPSEGYLLDTTVHKVGAEPQLYTVEHNQTANDVTEQVMKGNIAIIKHTDDGGTKIETPENGATFEIYLKSSGSFDSAEEDERDVIVCDENGFGQTKDMPYGVYTVHQTSGWEGRELMDDFDVFISQNGQTYRYLINNANFESYIKVVKVDAESGKNIPYAGAGFKIFDPDGNQVTMTFTYPTPTTIDIFYTDANGQLVTPEKLEYGKGYSLVEVQAPYGYVLDSTPVYFDVAEEHSSDEGGITVIKVDKPNMAQKGTVSIEKTGEVFSGVNISGEENADVIYQPVYEVKGLAGAVYEIAAAEDIITPDGTLRYAKGEVVDTVTTDENGLAKSKELYLGKYTVVEITAPEGMVINKEAHEVELTYAGQEVSVTETATSFVNDRQKVTVSLEKTIEKNDIFNIGNGDEMKNISFGLFAAEELVSASGTSIPADGLIEIISLSENGKAVIKTDIPFGSYYVKELATDEHYILSDAKYPFTFSYAGQDTANVEIAVNGGKPIENKLIYGSVSGKKITENGEALGGAVIGLFKADETVFTKENALMTATSENDGSFSFEKVPYGNWLVREIEQPEGFVLDETSYEVKISEVAQVIEVEIVNEYVHGNIKLTKVDEDYPDNKLTGATFEVYKDVNGDGKLDDGDELIGTLNETSTGIYEMKELLYGKYLVRETKAPEGFELDKGVYSVFIEKDETTYEVENKAGVGFINTAMKGNLKIVKTSSDGKVEGFTFRVTGVNGYDRSFTTDKNGEIVIEGLRIGDYTVSEVQDSVSASYVLPADKIATVKVGSTTVVEMHNELRDTPKTGDNSNVGLWTALAGLSALGKVKIIMRRIIMGKSRKKHFIIRSIILGMLFIIIIAGGIYCRFGGFGTGKSADIAEFAKYTGQVSEIIIPEETKIIALGEATHGNVEFQQLKLDVFQIMVENYGVRSFALEADYGCCETANRYIHGGEGTAEQAADALDFQIYKTDEIANLLSWMREYNEEAGKGEDICFYGFDMQSNEANYEYFIEMAGALGADTAELKKIWDNGTLNNDYTGEQRAEIIKGIKETLLGNENPETAQAVHFADILLQNIELGSAMENMQAGMALRDRFMAENTMWILEQEEMRGNKRIFISGHNGHVTQYGSYDIENKKMGYILADNIGEASYFVIGTDFYKTKNNMPQDNEKRTTFTAYSHDPLAKAAKKCGYGICWLDFSKIPEESALRGEVTGYCYMGNLGENQMSLLNRSIMRVLPYTYRIFGSPASMYDGMIFVADAHPTQIR